MNERTNERTNERMNERMKEGRKEECTLFAPFSEILSKHAIYNIWYRTELHLYIQVITIVNFYPWQVFATLWHKFKLLPPQPKTVNPISQNFWIRCIRNSMDKITSAVKGQSNK